MIHGHPTIPGAFIDAHDTGWARVVRRRMRRWRTASACRRLMSAIIAGGCGLIVMLLVA